LTNAPGQTLISDAYEAFPAWSPDGTQVAFTRTGPGGGIFIVNADGTAERRIVEGWARDVSWSPDGTQLVFAWLPEGWPPNPDNTIELVVVDVDGSNLQALNDFPELQGDAVTDIFPAWSPDGAWISFQHWTHAARAEEDVIELYVVSADGSTLQRIETGELEGGFGSWAPDGELLVISVGLLSDPNPPAIYTATLDDGQLERLALLNVPFLGGNLDLSPDGSQIALSSTSQDIHKTIDEESPAIDLFAVEVDSGEARVISELTDVQEVDPVWSPDGLRLLYLASLPRGGGQITVINADGSNPVTIVEGLGIQAQIWSPPMWRPAVE
jgi:Tol biopolymer transport system component